MDKAQIKKSILSLTTVGGRTRTGWSFASLSCWKSLVLHPSYELDIFLVNGNTKNDCDRMFNLLKYDNRKTNVYTPPQLYAYVNSHPQVTAIAMETDEDFLEFSSLQDMLMISAIKGCSKYHVFTVNAADTNTMMMQMADGEEGVPLVVVLPGSSGDDIDW